MSDGSPMPGTFIGYYYPGSPGSVTRPATEIAVKVNDGTYGTGWLGTDITAGCYVEYWSSSPYILEFYSSPNFTSDGLLSLTFMC